MVNMYRGIVVSELCKAGTSQGIIGREKRRRMSWLVGSTEEQEGLTCLAPLDVARAAAHQYAKAKEASDADREQEPCSAHDGQRLSFKVPMRWLVLACLSLEQETLQTYNTPSLIC